VKEGVVDGNINIPILKQEATSISFMMILWYRQKMKQLLIQFQRFYQPLHHVRNDKDSLTCNVREPSDDNELFQRLEQSHHHLDQYD